MSDVIVTTIEQVVTVVAPVSIVTVGSGAPPSTISAPQIVQQITTNNAPVRILSSALQGPAGPPGPTGPAGTGDLHYTHTQSIASATWNVVHSLGKFPSVSVVDSAGTMWMSDVHYIDLNSLTISFAAAFGGLAYIN